MLHWIIGIWSIKVNINICLLNQNNLNILYFVVYQGNELILILSTVSVNCKDTRIAVQVRTNKPFNGRIYALGRSETCNIDVVSSDLFRLDLTMTGQDCNTQSVVSIMLFLYKSKRLIAGLIRKHIFISIIHVNVPQSQEGVHTWSYNIICLLFTGIMLRTGMLRTGILSSPDKRQIVSIFGRFKSIYLEAPPPPLARGLQDYFFMWALFVF